MPNDTSARPTFPVRVGTLRAGVPLGFDIYVRVSDRFVRHTFGDDSLDKDRLNVLKEKGVKKVFIDAKDEPAYLQYLDSGLNALSSGEIPAESRAEVAQSTLADIAQSSASFDTEAGFNHTMVRVTTINDFLLSEQGMARTFLKTCGVSQDVAQHSATVSTLALSLAARLGINAKNELLELGLAAILHDIGKEEGNFDWSLSPERQTDPQKKAHLNHPAKAAAMLAEKTYISPAIGELILNHEEIGVGAGFPGKKKLSSLPMIQQALNICNHYDAYCMRSGIDPSAARQKFFIDKLGLFDLSLLTALSELIK